MKVNIEDNNPSIISFSRLVSLKGIDKLLSHSKTLFLRFPNLKLKIFGRGPLQPLLERIVRKENLHQHVMIMGHVPFDVLLKHIEKALVAVFPTFLEVGPFISALEAMALKKPVVAFDLPFNREFIKPYKTGMLAKAGNMDDFIDKISFLLSDQKLRAELGNAAFEYVKKHHNWAYVVDKYIKIYKEFACNLVS
jgi:glycosyltransferase involved in cell wall biosynthesis